jgi:tetratricopeptide (TPR) repeat protein
VSDSDDYQSKLNGAVQAIVGEYGDQVAGIFVIGSITQERTATSDCDVTVVFRGEFYRNQFDSIRAQLKQIADELNRNEPAHELVLWPSKEDHYLTMLPDVSYVRRNLPDKVERLDAWCGLAKSTLLAYEGSASQRVHGSFELPIKLSKIPRHESIELFLLSTRTLAEGLAELQSAEAAVRRRGMNHVAKAGLRAAYAATLQKDGVPRNSYREIYEAAVGSLPAEFHPILKELYAAKSRGDTEALNLAQVFSLMRHCEALVATVRRRRMMGLALGRAGESFGFTLEDILDGSEHPSEYRRFAGSAENYLQSLYFLMSAQEIAKRLVASGYTNSDGLDFFFEELTTIATYAFFNPDGIRIVVGRRERSAVELHFGLEFMRGLVPLVVGLAQKCLRESDSSGTPWLSARDKLARLQVTLAMIKTVPGLDVPSDILAKLNSRLGNALEVDAIIDWQLPLFDGVLNPLIVRNFAKIGLLFYQSRELSQARRILERLAANQVSDGSVASELGINAGPLRSEFSKACQFLAVTLQRQGEIAEALKRYEEALKLDPDNYSAIDDFAGCLLANKPADSAIVRLRAQLDQCRSSRVEATEQVSNAMEKRAIALKQAGDFASAERLYQEAIALTPRLEKVHYNYGVLQQQRGDVAQAVQLYHHAIELNPDYLNPYIGIGLILERAGRFAGAASVLEIPRQRGIANEHALTNLGNCYLHLGEFESAKSCYIEALAVNPEFANALGGMGNVLLLGPDASNPSIRDRAAEFLRRAYEADATYVEAKILHDRLRHER